MMSIIELKSFNIISLKMDQNPFEPSKSNDDSLIQVSYELKSKSDEPSRFMMILKITGFINQPSNLELGYHIEAAAEFIVPSNIPDSQKGFAVAFNGGSILYGLIRGQISVISANFPSGRVMLPTLNWKDVVDKVESSRKRKYEEAKSKVSSTKRKKKAVKKITAKKAKRAVKK